MSKRLGPVIAAIVAVLALAACGSSSSCSGSSGDAQSLLKQTFSSGHTVKSGVLAFNLSLKPTGSSTLSTPITLSLSGPFQSRGSGKLPQSDFTIGISGARPPRRAGRGLHRHRGLCHPPGEQLPAARRPTSRSSSRASRSSGSSGSATGLSQLGINPLHWLTTPSVVGTETVGGASTTHIRSGVDVTTLIADLNTFLAKTAKNTSAGAAGIPTQIPQATQQKIAAAIKHATVDVWTGKSDKTLRKLSLNLSVPVTGQVSTELGGMTLGRASA